MKRIFINLTLCALLSSCVGKPSASNSFAGLPPHEATLNQIVHAQSIELELARMAQEKASSLEFRHEADSRVIRAKLAREAALATARKVGVRILPFRRTMDEEMMEASLGRLRGEAFERAYLDGSRERVMVSESRLEEMKDRNENPKVEQLIDKSLLEVREKHYSSN